LEPIEDTKLLDKVGLVSLSFKNFTSWNGKGRMLKEDLERVTSVVRKAHSFKKPFRFWATPDSKTAWKAMAGLGVDYINTDHPFECVQYLNLLPQRTYINIEESKVYRPTFENDGVDVNPKNIILMIGDGNGLAQISATALTNGGSLSLTQLKNIGFLKTQSEDDFTTDSAGGATAMATGEKVPNRAIGVNANGGPISNLTERMHVNGFITAIITTDEISGATPASFFAHQKDRSMTEGILKDLGNSSLDFFVASKNDESAKGNELYGFQMVGSLEDFKTNENKKLGYSFPIDTIPASLNTAVRNILQNLEKKKDPFFLMVEGAKIDSYGHANKIDGIIKEAIAFDKAIGEALKFADTNRNTLVIITADHETGGLSLPQGNLEDKVIEADFTTDDHTGIFVPLFAYGPHSNSFRGVYENTEVFHKIIKALDISFSK
jgi:alkaline phosphatase